MADINNMSLKDFYGLMRYLKRKEKMRSGKPVELKDSQKEMIRRRKELKKDA